MCFSVFFCKHQVQACVCEREIHTHTHTHTHTASHSQFVLQALFLARGTYIIRVTLGGNKRKGKKHLLHFLYPLSAAFSFCFKHPPPDILPLLLSIFPLLHFLVSPPFFLPLRSLSTLPGAPCLIIHLTPHPLFPFFSLLLSSCIPVCFPHPSSVSPPTLCCDTTLLRDGGGGGLGRDM